MRFKLRHKLLAVNLGIIVVLTASLVILNYSFSSGMFSGALNGIDREVVKQLTKRLGAYHEREGNWEGLIQEPSTWSDTVNQTFFSVFFSLMEAAGNNPRASFPSLQNSSDGLPTNEHAWDMPFGTFLERTALLGPDKQVLIPAEVTTEKTSETAIRDNGTTVGWLRVGTINVDMLPLANYFFKQQMTLIYGSTILGGLVAAVLSILFSHHLTAPIKKLIIGARRIGQRKFDTKIEINSKDELQELAESFQLLANQLATHSQQQRQWLTHISHELKAPLTVLVGEIYAICDNLSACDENTVVMLQEEVDHVKRLADDLFEMSKMEEIGYKYQLAEIDVQDVLTTQVRHYQNRFDRNKLTVHSSWSPEPAIVLGDADRLAQVFGNLFENCIRYSGSPANIALSVEKPGKTVVINLRDSGAGVAPENIDKLFDRFYSYGTTSAGKPKGAGLGLAICRKIIKDHRGTIAATNGENGGLCIRIELPGVT